MMTSLETVDQIYKIGIKINKENSKMYRNKRKLEFEKRIINK